MLVNRRISEYVLQRLTQIPIVALLGSRQVGKTTLAKYLQTATEKETIYLDLESDEDLTKLRDAEYYLQSREDKLIIIDEVQRMTELFPVLRSVIDRNRSNGRFILLGSASPELLVKSSETLAGRIAYIEVNPLTFDEVSHVATWKQLWLRGGYPDALLHGDDIASYLNRSDFLKTYIERELPMLGLPGSTVALSRNLLRMVAHIHSNTINYSDLSRSLGSHINTVKNVISYFEHSFITRLLQPYHLNIAKRIVKSPKAYIRDSGIFHVLSGIENEEDLEGFNQKGHSWEGFVIQQIIPLLKPQIEYYFYRTQDGSELDLVLAKGARPVLGIEIKYSNAPTLSKGTFIAAEDLGNIPVLVVTPSVSEDYQPRPGQYVTAFPRLYKHELLRPYLI